MFVVPFTFDGKSYAKVTDITNKPPLPLLPAQPEVSVARLMAYLERMRSGKWRWNEMFTLDVRGQKVFDPIRLGHSPLGKIIIDDGQHRVVAAHLLGLHIATEAFDHFRLEQEPKNPLTWEQTFFLHYDCQQLYPIQ